MAEREAEEGAAALAAEIGFITGTGLYALEGGNVQGLEVTSGFGHAVVSLMELGGKKVAHIARHGAGHRLLPNMINYRANMWAMMDMGVRLVVGTTVCGILRPEVPLGRLILFDDLFFPENRLPDGSACTMYTEPGDPRRGHFIGQPFSPGVRELIRSSAEALGGGMVDGGVYAQVSGPRFNTPAEIRFLQGVGVLAISQTAAAEAVLAAELEIPYALVGFGVDYAAGVKEPPTAPEELRANLEAAGREFSRLLAEIARRSEPESVRFDSGVVFRFE